MTTSTSTSRAILGPLTTTFTPPAVCDYVLVFASSNAAISAGWQGQGCVSSGSAGVGATSCWPGTSAGATPPANYLYNWGFYSPGTVCPSGYTSACTATAGGHSDWEVAYTMVADETAVGCCPSNYGCFYGGGNQRCVFTASATSILTASCASNNSFVSMTEANIPLTSTLEYYLDETTVITTTTVSTDTQASKTTPISTTEAIVTFALTTQVETVTAFVAQAAMVQINWQSTDRGAAVATATSSGGSMSTNGSSGLSGGAVAGVVVGCVAGAALVIGAGIGFLLRKKRRRHTPQLQVEEEQKRQPTQQHLEPRDREIARPRPELDVGYPQAAEVAYTPDVRELPVPGRPIYEAP